MHMAKIEHDWQHLVISVWKVNKNQIIHSMRTPWNSTITPYHANDLDMDEAKLTEYLGQHLHAIPLFKVNVLQVAT